MRIQIFLLFLFVSLCLHAAEKPSVTVSTLLKDAVNVDDFPNTPEGYPGVWSSYDRTGGMLDDQGYIRKEGGKFVIAEMMGPGAITRIWANQPKGKIEVFVDDGGKPVMTVSAADVFSGRMKPFVKPWVASAKNGGCYSFIPIPYDRFCKITATEQFAYEIEYLTYPSETVVEPFKLSWSKTHTNTQAAAAKSLQTNGDPPFKLDRTFVEDAFAFPVPAAQTVEFASREGPEIIKGIQLQWDDRDVRFGRDLSLEIHWDHQDEPAVQVPVFDFFGGGSSNWLVGVNKDNEGYCYFPMPFQRSARLSVRNDNLKDEIPVHITLYIQTVKTLQEPVNHFYAGWHFNTPQQKSFPVSFDMQRKTPVSESAHNLTVFQSYEKGHLAGITLTQAASLQSDIQFLSSFGMRNLSLQFSGLRGFMNLISDKTNTTASFCSSISAKTIPLSSSRLFLPTPLPFEERTRMIVENGHANLAKQSTAVTLYWYQQEPGQPYSPLPPAQARQFRQVPVRSPLYRVESDSLVPIPVMEAENAEVIVSGGIFEPQDMSPYGSDWSQNQQLRFEGFQEGAELQLQLPDVQYSGWYDLKGVFTKAPDAGVVKIQIPDHVFEEEMDLYAEDVQPLEYVSPSPAFLHAGDPVVVSLTILGASEASTGLNAGTDYLELVSSPLSPDTVSITAPLYQEIQTNKQVLQKFETPQNITVPIGFAVSSNINRVERKKDSKHDGVSLDKKTLGIPNNPDAMVFVSFEMESDKSGIFRFEIHGDPIRNSILRLSGDKLVRTDDQIWVNGIPLHADEVIYWDVEKHDFKPRRYSVPLQKGSNQISWVMDGEPVTIRPVFYGLNP